MTRKPKSKPARSRSSGSQAKQKPGAARPGKLADLDGAGDVNRTGITLAPEKALAMAENAREESPEQPGDASGIHETRDSYQSEGATIGTVPRCGDGRDAGLASFVDKLGERLTFERTGVRLYEAAIHRFEGDAGIEGDELLRIRDEELQHFHMLHRAIVELGCDPTAVTPSADLVQVLSRGIQDAIVDPRTTLPQCLQALLTAELADNAGWELLRDMARGLGREELSEQFQQALDQEERHLELVKGWLSELTLEQAGVEDDGAG